MNLVQIRSFPEKDYTCDGLIQQKLNQRARFRSGFIRYYIVGFIVFFAGILISQHFQFKLLAWLLLGVEVIGAILAMVILTQTPSLKCTKCGESLKRQYVKRGSGSDEDLFLVCHPCRRYADVHFSRE